MKSDSYLKNFGLPLFSLGAMLWLWGVQYFVLRFDIRMMMAPYSAGPTAAWMMPPTESFAYKLDELFWKGNAASLTALSSLILEVSIFFVTTTLKKEDIWKRAIWFVVTSIFFFPLYIILSIAINIHHLLPVDHLPRVSYAETAPDLIVLSLAWGAMLFAQWHGDLDWLRERGRVLLCRLNR
ncbi:MAG: hypothetical protein GXP42_17365 [Chloroflexi bacterium]|nr:hypothetical protein [Chloroflexota bacterium]